MRLVGIILASSILCFTSCRKDKDAEGMLGSGPPGWMVEKFYVNNNDVTDSLLNIITPTQGPPYWGCYFSSDHSLCCNVGGEWTFTNKDATILSIHAYNSNGQVGPFLANGTAIFWDFDYDKLCNDDKVWIKTNYNNKSYEVHLYKQ